MRPSIAVARVPGLPPVVMIAPGRSAPPDAHGQEILVLLPAPSLGQALRLVGESLRVLIRCTCRLCRQYVLVHGNGYAYANHWYTRDTSSR